jgi:hypothetical protein
LLAETPEADYFFRCRVRRKNSSKLGERFLIVMDQVVPWTRLVALFKPCYPERQTVVQRNRNLNVPERQLLADSVEKVGQGLRIRKVRVRD